MGSIHPATLSTVAMLVIAAAFSAAPSRSRAGPTPCHAVVAGDGRPVLVGGGACAGGRRPVRPGRRGGGARAERRLGRVRARPARDPRRRRGLRVRQARLRPEFHPALDGLAAALRRSPGRQVALVGHTDSGGPERYNRELSLRRARAVADYLQRAGVAPERLFVAGDGEGRPTADNETAAGRARNRRVEVTAL